MYVNIGLQLYATLHLQFKIPYVRQNLNCSILIMMKQMARRKFLADLMARCNILREKFFANCASFAKYSPFNIFPCMVTKYCVQCSAKFWLGEFFVIVCNKNLATKISVNPLFTYGQLETLIKKLNV